jgi:hypothetical protein
MHRNLPVFPSRTLKKSLLRLPPPAQVVDATRQQFTHLLRAVNGER